MSHEPHHHEPSGAVEENDKAVCPVMNIITSKRGAAANGIVRTIKGNSYYLCCNNCAADFDTEPEKYTSADIKK